MDRRFAGVIGVCCAFATAGCSSGEPVLDQRGLLAEYGLDAGADAPAEASGGSGATASSSSSKASSTSHGAGGGHGASGGATQGSGGGGDGVTSAGGGGTCTDATSVEPNESESSATEIAAIDDCDDSGGSLAGALSGASDVDWFWYDASDVAFCLVTPTRLFSSGVRLCKYFECKGGTAPIVECDGGEPSTSPEGRPGCCAEPGSGELAASVDCYDTWSDDAYVFIRVEPSGSAGCQPYGLEFHY